MKLFTARKVSASVSNSFQKGFTLIELLVVIGILGILAAALVATIDPFEQLNKATDARKENTVVEMQNGLLRYYTIKGMMPWDDAVDDCDSGGALSGTPMKTGTTAHPCVTALINQGELKATFANSADLTTIFLTGAALSTSPSVCYEPISKSKQRDPNTDKNQDGTPWSGTGTCKSDGGAADCFWCSQ